MVIDAPPQLSLFAFHLSWPGANQQQQNAATSALMDRVTARGRVMLTGAMVDERYLGRVCVLSFRTRQAQMDGCVDDVTTEAAAILAGQDSLSRS
jgi:aromatic-L-amino-acid decarboxylase